MSMQLLGKSISYVIDTRNREARKNWKELNFNETIGIYKDDIRNLREQIFTLEKEKKFSECGSIATKLIRYENKDPVAYLGLSLSCEANSKPQEALEKMNKAISMSSAEDKLSFEEKKFEQLCRITEQATSPDKGYYLGQMKKFGKTIFQNENADTASLVQAHVQSGYIAKIEKDEIALIQHFEAAKKLGVNHPSIHCELAVAYYNQRQFNLAYDSFQAYLFDHPNDHEAKIHCCFAALYIKTNSEFLLQKVEQQFWQIIETCSDKNIVSQAYTGLAEIYSRDKSKLDKSIEMSQIALTEDPHNLCAWRKLGNLYVNKGDRKSLYQAIACYERCEGNDEFVSVDRALAYYESGQKLRAKEELTKLIGRSSSDKSVSTVDRAARKAHEYIENCEFTQQAFILADIVSFVTLKVAHKILEDRNYHYFIHTAAHGYSVAYPLLKDISFAWVKSYAYASLSKQRQNIYLNEVTLSPTSEEEYLSRSHELTHITPNNRNTSYKILLTKENIQFTLYAMHKFAQMAQLGNQLMPDNPVLMKLDTAAGYFESGYEIYNMGECIGQTYTSFQKYRDYLNDSELLRNLGPEEISNLLNRQLLETGLNAAMTGSMLIRFGKRHYDSNLVKRIKAGEQLSENKLGCILYNATNLITNDYTAVFILQPLTTNPDLASTLINTGEKLYNSGVENITWLWSTGPFGQAVVVAGAGVAVYYIGSRVYQYYNESNISTKLQNAETLINQKKYEDALVKIQEIISVKPTDENIKRFYDITSCRKHLENKNYKMIISIANHYVDNDANDLIMHGLRGTAYFYESNYLQAESDFQKITEVDPTNANAHISLADVQRLQDKHEYAYIHYTAASNHLNEKIKKDSLKDFTDLNKQLNNLKESRINVLLEHARHQMDNQDFHAAISTYEKLMTYFPNNSKIEKELLETRCLYHLKNNEPQEVIRLTEAQLISEDLNQNILRLRGRAWLEYSLTDTKQKNEYLKNSEDIWRKLLDTNNEDHDVHEQLGHVLRYQNQEIPALSHYKTAVTLLREQITKLTAENKPAEYEKTLHSLHETLKYINNALEETNAHITKIGDNIKEDINKQFEKIRIQNEKNNEKNDNIFYELNRDYLEFSETACNAFNDAKTNAILYVEEHKPQLFDEKREEIKKLAIAEYERFCTELRPVLEKRKANISNLKQDVKDMEDMEEKISSESENMLAQNNQFEIFNSRIHPEKLEELKNYFRDRQKSEQDILTKKISEYKKQIVNNELILQKVDDYLEGAKLNFEKELDGLLDNYIKTNTYNLWANTIGEFIGTFAAQTLQSLFDWWTDSYHKGFNVNTLPIPKWEESKTHYPKIFQLPRESSWKNQLSEIPSFKEVESQTFFSQSISTQITLPKEIDSLVIANENMKENFAETKQLMAPEFQEIEYFSFSRK